MSPNPLDYIAIQNTLARYCLALDTKNFALLREVFTSDVDARYSFLKQYDGARDVDVLADAIRRRLAPVTSQHSLTTQHIEISSDGKRASATSYFSGVHFGQGRWKGQQVTAHGLYRDELRLVEGGVSIPGASGQWLIEKRELEIFGRLGEEGVMEGG